MSPPILFCTSANCKVCWILSDIRLATASTFTIPAVELTVGKSPCASLNICSNLSTFNIEKTPTIYNTRIILCADHNIYVTHDLIMVTEITEDIKTSFLYHNNEIMGTLKPLYLIRVSVYRSHCLNWPYYLVLSHSYVGMNLSILATSLSRPNFLVPRWLHILCQYIQSHFIIAYIYIYIYIIDSLNNGHMQNDGD